MRINPPASYAVVRDDAGVRDYVQANLGLVLSPPYVGFAVIDPDRNCRGAVVFNDYTGQNVELTVHGRGCWTPAVVRRLLGYVWGELGCHRMTARTHPGNTAARRALKAMGFKVEGTAREWFQDGSDAILYGCLARECRLTRRTHHRQ